MGANFRRFSTSGSVVGFVAFLMWSGAALAQDSNNNAAGAVLAGTMMLVFLAFAAAGYVYMSLALQTIATKTSTENPWLAWIPIANLFLMLAVAKKQCGGSSCS